MTPVAFLLAAMAPLAPAEPPAAHDALLQVGDRPAVRLRLRVELDAKPLTTLDAEAKRTRAGLKGKPGEASLDRLIPDGSLLRAEAVAAAPHHAALTRVLAHHIKEHGFDAEGFLRRFDLDDDDCVTALELVPDLQTVVPEKSSATTTVRVSVVPVAGKADLERTVTVGRTGSFWRGEVGGVWVELRGRPGLAGERPVMPGSLLAADRAEAKAAFEQLAPGVVSLVAVPGPVGWFDRLDADRDGQLSVAELRRAKAALAGASADDTGVSLVLTPGVAKPPAVPLARTFDRTAGPQWFRATDRNGDGFVSPREFPGTAEQFRKIDADADGLIEPAEAAAATPADPKGATP